jgi:hypothetical protein
VTNTLEKILYRDIFFTFHTGNVTDVCPVLVFHILTVPSSLPVAS